MSIQRWESKYINIVVQPNAYHIYLDGFVKINIKNVQESYSSVIDKAIYAMLELRPNSNRVPTPFPYPLII